MAEIPNDPIYEVLKIVHEDGARTREDMRSIREEHSAIRGHINALQRDMHNVYDRLDEHTRRFERIERRLELNESPM